MLAFSVVVPTTNSAGHIDIVLDFYAAALATARSLCGSDFDETARRLAAFSPTRCVCSIRRR